MLAWFCARRPDPAPANGLTGHMPFSLLRANPMEQSPKQLRQKLPILKYTRQSEIETLSGVIYIHLTMSPATFYCFTVAKTNASISSERVTNAIDIVNKLHGVDSDMYRFHSRITDPHCQVVRSVNSAM